MCLLVDVIHERHNTVNEIIITLMKNDVKCPMDPDINLL